MTYLPFWWKNVFKHVFRKRGRRNWKGQRILCKMILSSMPMVSALIIQLSHHRHRAPPGVLAAAAAVLLGCAGASPEAVTSPVVAIPLVITPKHWVTTPLLDVPKGLNQLMEHPWLYLESVIILAIGFRITTGTHQNEHKNHHWFQQITSADQKNDKQSEITTPGNPVSWSSAVTSSESLVLNPFIGQASTRNTLEYLFSAKEQYSDNQALNAHGCFPNWAKRHGYYIRWTIVITCDQG